jgi:hypothetical protein
VELYLHYPNTPSWYGVQLNHMGNLTIPLPFVAELQSLTYMHSRVYFLLYSDYFKDSHLQRGGGIYAYN